METSTGPVSEARKMRVSFLVLVGVIAACNTDVGAKAVASVTEDEPDGVGQGPAEPDPKNDTACEGAVKKSNAHGGEHVLIKRQTSSDSGKRRSVISKKFDRKRRTESKKFKYEERKTRTVSNKTRSVRKDKNRHGRLAINNWYVPEIRPKSFSFPPIYSPPGGEYDPWTMQAHFQANAGNEEHEASPLLARDILKVEELADVFHTSLKEGLQSLFDALDRELRKKLGNENAPAVTGANARSSCIDTGDGSCESESADDAYDAVSPNDCSDDAPTGANDSGSGIASGCTGKRSESPVEYLRETLPGVVRAAETILGESIENARSFGGGGVVADDGVYDGRSSAWGAADEAAESVPGDGIDNARSVSWDFADLDTDGVPAG